MTNSKTAPVSASSTALVTPAIAGHAINDVQSAAKALATAAPGSKLHERILAITANFDKSDVIAIAVTNEEERIHTDQIKGMRELDQLNTQHRDLKEQFDTIGPKLTKGIDTTADQVAVKALADADYGKFKIEVILGSTDEKGRKWTFQVTIKDTKSSYNDHRREVVIPFTPDAISLLKQVRTTLEDIQEVQTALVHLKQEKASLPAYARRVQAKMAECAIRQMAEGEALLAEMSSVKALPLLGS